ncbi:uncharacterized protein LOC114516028 isoform X2 [Dendronephthya gigantea]|uniref:uncharacterized protein LOC114516028 isoform X2 n=1 Tax=Dendronephthya gigantea TaxID=151771 RepID=UPI00106919C3|nr:uncharacterized protein LOC114516028 isoform X2 [Dendronephthya gigantea]
MAHYTSTIRGPSHVVSHSYVQSIKPTKVMDIHDKTSTDHSIFIGYGSNAKRIKDRWEATKKQLRFENNYIAFKWLLDSFVDDYLRSKNMEDTATLTRDTMYIKKERRIDEVSTSQSRRPATRSPSKTRFEDGPERKENGIVDNQSHSKISESRQHHVPPINEPKSVGSSRMAGGGNMPISGQYYKYFPEYWSPHYYWHAGSVPMNSRMVNVSSVAGLNLMKTPSCSSLPTGDTHNVGGGLRTSESLKQLHRDGKDVNRGESSSATSVKRPAVNLGFKTKSMPNLQFIPNESEVNSDEDDDIESDPESQGDLMALSSLSMPNLRKIPPDRPPLMSPPSPRGRYEPAPLSRDRHDASMSMPNLQAIQGGMENDDRKKTIRDFLMNRLTSTKDHEQGERRTKIFQPNGYYPQSERKLVIRERLLNRMAKRKREENAPVPGSHYNGKMTPQGNSPLKFAKKLPRVPESSRFWPDRNYLHAPARDSRILEREDHVNNNWRIPQGAGTSEQPKNMWNRSAMKKTHTNTGIWNPADVHVKREKSPTATQNDVTSEEVTTSSVDPPEEDEQISPRSPSANDSNEERTTEGDSRGEEEEEGVSGDEEEHIDVENVKDDEMKQSGGSESDPDEDEEDASDEERKNKRTRKTDKPRKRLKAM